MAAGDAAAIVERHPVSVGTVGGARTRCIWPDAQERVRSAARAAEGRIFEAFMLALLSAWRVSEVCAGLKFEQTATGGGLPAAMAATGAAAETPPGRRAASPSSS